MAICHYFAVTCLSSGTLTSSPASSSANSCSRRARQGATNDGPGDRAAGSTDASSGFVITLAGLAGSSTNGRSGHATNDGSDRTTDRGSAQGTSGRAAGGANGFRATLVVVMVLQVGIEWMFLVHVLIGATHCDTPVWAHLWSWAGFTVTAPPSRAGDATRHSR